MLQDNASLIGKLDDLLVELDATAAASQEQLAKVHPAHRSRAENLVHYAHLRTIDIRAVQNELHDLGVTSLTTVESETRGRLLLARNVLTLASGQSSDTDVAAIIAADEAADEALENSADLLLGVERDDVPARIMVTLPSEAAQDAEMVLGFAEAGMDLARINCAHDGPDVWLKMIANVHAASAKVGRKIEVSMDLAGPKLRTGDIEPGPRVGRARVTRDDAGMVLTPAKLWLTSGDDAPLPPAGLSGRPALPISVEAEWLAKVHIGSVISLHDNRSAKREFTVTQIIDGGVLAEGQRNAYISEGTLLRCDYEKTRAMGIPPTVQKLRFFVGDELVLTTDPAPTAIVEEGVVPRINCSLVEAIDAVEVGDPVLFDDGAIAAVVVNKCSSPCGSFQDVRLKVTRAKPGGQNLAAHKGINLPKTELPFPSLTDEDIEHLRFVVEHADVAAVSFIRTVEDVEQVLAVIGQIVQEHDANGRPDLAEKARNLGIVAKIETIPAFENLPNVMLTLMQRRNVGLMIARGDLAVELGFSRMGEVPGQILALAQAAGLPTILGTQVLETLAKAGLPSRAEITDAAFALRAECVMLNKGPHINDAIGILDNLAKKMGRSQRKSRIMLRRIRSWDAEYEPENSEDS